MIKIEHTEVLGWDHTIRGMRNPMNSWEKSDSTTCNIWCSECPVEHGSEICEKIHTNTQFGNYVIGPNDLDLMLKLSEAGTDHAKFRRMITVYVDLTAPLYWWKEFDTYKVGTVANSCSTMHKIAEKEFTLEDFSHEYLISQENMDFLNRFDVECSVTLDTGIYAMPSNDTFKKPMMPMDILQVIVDSLNQCRNIYLKTHGKKYWWQMIQLLPSSYNQKRTVMLNYEVLANIYKSRKDHKLDEWREFCKWIEELPYSEIITLETKGVEAIEY